MIHTLIAVTLQLVLFGLTGNTWYGVSTSVFYAGRELAQAEYRWIETYGGGKRANMPFTGQFDPRVWSFKSLSDMAFPIAATAGLAIAHTLYS